MPITIGSNIGSLQAQRRLAESSNTLSSVFERLASGQRINRASDDAAGLAVASDLNVRSRVFTQALRNLNDGISALSIADSAVAQLSEIVTRQRELAEQSANGTFSDTEREALDLEAQALANEHQRILESAEFNGLKLLDGSNSSIALQAGYGTDAILSTDLLADAVEGTVVNDPTADTLNLTDPSAGTNQHVTSFITTDIDGDGLDDLLGLYIEDDGGTGYGITFATFLQNDDGSFTKADEITKTGTLINSGGIGISIESHTSAANRVDLRFADTGLNFFDEDFTYDSSGNITDVTDQSGVGLENFGTSSTADLNGDGTNDSVSAGGTRNISTSVSQLSTIETGTKITLNQSSFSLATASSALTALDALGTELSTLSNFRGQLGASQSRIQVAQNVLSVSTENFRAAESRIRDADIAQTSSSLVRNNILQQAGAAVLAQANLQPQIVLGLIR